MAADRLDLASLTYPAREVSQLPGADANPEEYARSMASIPLRQLGDPVAEIGPAVAFLRSPAAGYVTGTTIALDGGQACLR